MTDKEISVKEGLEGLDKELPTKTLVKEEIVKTQTHEELYERLKEQNKKLSEESQISMNTIEKLSNEHDLLEDSIELLQTENKELKFRKSLNDIYRNKRINDKYQRLLVMSKLLFSYAYEDEESDFDELTIKKKDYLARFEMK